jgi:putative FmdB family regulatory protein
VPVYEFRCDTCGRSTDRLLSHSSAQRPDPCEGCGAPVTRRFSRIAVRLEGWGFARTDGLVPERRGRGSFREVRERAERIGDGGAP